MVLHVFVSFLFLGFQIFRSLSTRSRRVNMQSPKWTYGEILMFSKRLVNLDNVMICCNVEIILKHEYPQSSWLESTSSLGIILCWHMISFRDKPPGRQEKSCLLIAEWDPSAPLTPAFHPILVQTANTHDEIIFMQSLFFSHYLHCLLIVWSPRCLFSPWSKSIVLFHLKADKSSWS